MSVSAFLTTVFLANLFSSTDPHVGQNLASVAGAPFAHAVAGLAPSDSGLAPSDSGLAPSASRALLKLTNSELARASAEAAQRGALPQYQGELTQALDTEIGTKAPKVVAKFAATDAGAFALAQWRLLSSVKPDEWATLTSQHANTVAWLLSNRNTIELFLTSGDVEGNRWGDAVRIFAEIAAVDPEVLDTCDDPKNPPLPLRLAVATALVHAAPVTWMADGSVIDPVKRYQSYRAWDKEGVLFASFRELSAWEMRYVVGSWSSDEDLVWARANIKPELKVREKVGDGAHMLAYNLFNKNGVSVQEGGKFYDNKPMTLAIMLEYGGVCGAISRFGTSMSQAFGVPAMPVGQPGHCAFIWQIRPHEWAINNDISGWAESGCHGGIHMTWGHPAWLMPLMQSAQEDRVAFARSEMLRCAGDFLAGTKADAGDRAAVYGEACDERATNYGAWRARLDAMRAAERDVKTAQWRDAMKRASAAFVRQPMAYATLVAIAEPALLPAKPTDKARTEYARGVAANIAAMAKAGADATLADFAVREVVVRQAEAIGDESKRSARAIVLGEDPPAGEKLNAPRAADVVDLALGAANELDVAPDGSAHAAWQRQIGRVVAGFVRQPSAREHGLKRVEVMVAALMKAKREGDARWIADRVVEAAKATKDADLERQATAFRASLG